ncbi:MAG TPA: cellulase family glycosylhydrolase [Terriglobales bacterium]|nr:cellulase family glycosylhydrolase [Terriglobales bacterium]
MRKFFLVLLFAAPFLFAQNPSFPRPGTEIAARRLERIRHGVNLSHWFAQLGSETPYDARHFGTYNTSKDIELIARTGFDHVRLTFNPEPLMLPNGELEPAMLQALDAAVDTVLANGLNVILDAHPESPFKQRLSVDFASRKAFVIFWQKFALHELRRDPERVFFELLNEPEFESSDEWSQYQNQIVSGVRAVDRQHTLILGGAKWSGMWELLHITPSEDGNVIYNFHYYDPHTFTHQGATWSMKWLIPLRGLRYPAVQDQKKLADAQPTLEGKLGVIHYGFDSWGFDRISQEIGVAADWTRLNHVVLTCNEFGVYRRFTEPVDREKWLSDVRTALEKNGIGWTIWDYAGGFGVVVRENGKTNVDTGIVKALALSPKKPGAVSAGN